MYYSKNGNFDLDETGVLRPPLDDPYDLMRRSRLIEPRSRARSISPHRQSNQRDTRSQSVIRNNKDRKASTDTVSRTEWFDTETQSYDENSRNPRASFSVAQTNDWLAETSPEEPRNAQGRVVRVAKKPRTWQENSSSTRTQENSRRKPEEENWTDVTTSNTNGNTTSDSRKSILECDVNPYHLVQKQIRDEDDLSDDLSDNALELEESQSSSLFDPSKVKSIERLPNRSSVAAIGGQRIRVFNEPREISDEDETSSPVTRIPIPKISPKRPPRRAKETRATLKSILRRGKADGKRKNVLFNVNNVIFAPEKPAELVINNRRNNRNSISVCKDSPNDNVEEPIVPDEQIPERPKFITIPNIRDPKRSTRVHEPKIVPEVKCNPAVEKLKIEQFATSRKPEVPVRNSSRRDSRIVDEMRSLSDSTLTEASVDAPSASSGKSETRSIASEDYNPDKNKTRVNGSETSLETIRPEDETELEIEIEELENRLPEIDLEEKELIRKSGGKLKKYLTDLLIDFFLSLFF